MNRASSWGTLFSVMKSTLTCLISGGVRLLEIVKKIPKIGKILAYKTIFLSHNMTLKEIQIIKLTQQSVHAFCTPFHTPGKAPTQLGP